MVGHSKWSNHKHIKGPLDVKHGAALSKLVKEITVAARIGGGDSSGNPCLCPIIEIPHNQNMLKEDIERAIKKGIGELEGANPEETLYEGYASGGVTAATDTKSRSAADLINV